MPHQVYHGGQDTPDEWQRDLQGAPIAPTRFASDMKDIQRLHPGLSGEELKRIPVLSEGTGLTQGTKYFDLLHPELGEISAGPGMRANEDNYYVAKTDVDYPLWNRMVGVTDPARLDQAPDTAQA